MRFLIVFQIIAVLLAAGTDLFFYCEVHKAGMDTPNGTIHVVAP